MGKSVELLLPVGNMEMALAAIHNGADAIYLGFPGFNARGRTHDFSISELRELVEICHLHGVRVHLALNILVFQHEMAEVVERLREILPLQPDALIVQDLGLAKLIRKMSPEQRLHASTQMTVSNFDAIELLEDLDIQRFVLARENSLGEIQAIREKTTKELEVFVHGALCVSYSGQCFTSESIGGRSANRGQCAQSCRFAYDIYKDGVLFVKQLDQKYIVSPQDLCGISEVPELIDIGVDSFKIEGRLKSSEYVAQTARSYRAAVESHANHSQLDVDELKKKMAITYSRGFFSGWLKGVDHQQLVNGTFGSHRGFKIGKVAAIRLDTMVIELNQDGELKAGDGLLWSFLKNGKTKDDGAQVYSSRRISSRRWQLKFAKEKRLTEEWIGADLYQNHDPELTKDLAKSVSDKDRKKRTAVKIELKLQLGEPLYGALSDGRFTVDGQTTSTLQVAKNQAIGDDFLREEFSSLSNTVFFANEVLVHRQQTEGLFISHRELKELRRTLVEKMGVLRRQHNVVGSTTNDLKDIEPLLKVSQEVADVKPTLNVLLREIGQVEDFVTGLSNGKILRSSLGTIFLDFEFGRNYAAAIELLKSQNLRFGVATTRILKPKEYQNLKHIESLNPDVILVRNLGALNYFLKAKTNAELVGDFSLNVANSWTAEYLLGKGLKSVCASYDLNHHQMDDLISSTGGRGLEVTIHQYMPSFHMEHCVFAYQLSQGSSFRDCGKPCERHRLELKDQFGNRHHLKADQECRNTMYNANAISALRYLGEWQKRGLSILRFEALFERSEALVEKIRTYQEVLAGLCTVENALLALKAQEQYGLAEGALAKEQKYLDRKKSQKEPRQNGCRTHIEGLSNQPLEVKKVEETWHGKADSEL